MEKQSYTAISNTPSLPPSPSDPLIAYQTLVGNVDDPEDVHPTSLYHNLVAAERSATHWFYITATLIYSLIATQIILCLGIAVGSQKGMSKDNIAIVAAVNTAVAAAIGVMKAFGVPEKKDAARMKLRGLVGKVKMTTRQLMAGMKVDVLGEAEGVREEFEGSGKSSSSLLKG